MTKKENARLDFLDSLRALAALGVLFHHAYLQVWPTEYGRWPAAGWERTLTGWLAYGNVRVDLFIVLSGFCLMLPVVRGGDGKLRGGVGNFFARRVHRILPPYYLGVAFSALLAAFVVNRETGSHWDVSVPVTWEGMLANVLLIQDVFRQGSINHAYWTLAVEMKLYVLFPLFVLSWRRFGAVPTALGMIGLGYLAYFGVAGTKWWGLRPHFLALHALGMLGATIAFSAEGATAAAALRRRVPWGAAAAGAAAGFILLCSLLGWERAMKNLGPMDLLVGLGAMCLLVAAARPGPNRLCAALSWKPLVFLGTFAYSLFLIHAPLLQVIWQYALRPLHLSDMATFCLLVFGGTPVICVVAYGFYLVCERPFLNRKPAPAGGAAAGDAPRASSGQEPRPVSDSISPKSNSMSPFGNAGFDAGFVTSSIIFSHISSLCLLFWPLILFPTPLAASRELRAAPELANPRRASSPIRPSSVAFSRILRGSSSRRVHSAVCL